MFALLVAAMLLTQYDGHTYDQYGIEVPPAAYDHFPTRPLLRIVVPLEQVTGVCDHASVNMIYKACTKFAPSNIKPLIRNPSLGDADQIRVSVQLKLHPDLCVVVLPELSPLMSFEEQWNLARHEYAHCNGVLHDPATARGWYLYSGKKVD